MISPCHFTAVIVSIILIEQLLLWNTVNASPFNFLDHRGFYTFYDYVADKHVKHPLMEKCTTQKTWTMIKRGTFDVPLPMQMTVIKEKILKNMQSSWESFDPTLLKRFQEWDPKRFDNVEESLDEKCEEAIRGIASRSKRRLPEVLDVPYEESKLKFASEDDDSENSMNAFLEQIYPAEIVAKVIRSDLKDTAIAAYDARYEQMEEDFDSDSAEREQYKYYLMEMGNRFNTAFTWEEATDIYKAYAIETALHPDEESVWRYALTEEMMGLFDYTMDLKLYNYFGYRYESIYASACFMFKEIVDSFENPASRNVFYFTESESAASMLAFLDLFKDDEPLSSDVTEINADRKWRSNRIAPQPNVLEMILLGCEDGKRYVVLMLQEREVEIPNCGLPCDYDVFVSMLKDRISDEECMYRGR